MIEVAVSCDFVAIDYGGTLGVAGEDFTELIAQRPVVPVPLFAVPSRELMWKRNNSSR